MSPCAGELRAANSRGSCPVRRPGAWPLADLVGNGAIWYFFSLLSPGTISQRGRRETKRLQPPHNRTEIFIPVIFIHSLYFEAVLKVRVKAEPASSGKARCYYSEIIPIRTDQTNVTLAASSPQLSQLLYLIFAFLPLS